MVNSTFLITLIISIKKGLFMKLDMMTMDTFIPCRLLELQELVETQNDQI